MKPLHRSLLGALVALAAVPVFLGLQACIPAFPVPIGDPEKSRIDPELSGLWISDGGSIVMLEPWDKRTWLLTAVPVEADESESCGSGSEMPNDGESDIELQDEAGVEPASASADDIVIEDDVADDEWTYAEFVSEMEAYGPACLSAGTVELYKVWRTQLGKQWFMTWEPMGYFDDEYGYQKAFWLVMAIEKVNTDTLLLRWIDAEAEIFTGLESLAAIEDAEAPVDAKLQRKARHELERTLRRNADNEDLYAEELFHFERVQPEHYELFNSVVTDALQDLDL